MVPYACTATSTKNDDSASDCGCHIIRQPGRRNGISLCEYSRALRLASELADLRTANADRIRLRSARRSPVDLRGDAIKRYTPDERGYTFLWRRHSESDRGIRVLQTRALPLGYGALLPVYYIKGLRFCQ